MGFAKAALSSYIGDSMRKRIEDNKLMKHTIPLKRGFSGEGESIFEKLSRKVLFLKCHAHKATKTFPLLAMKDA